MRRLLVFFVILVAIAIVGDLALRSWAESRAEVQLQEELDLARRPDVSLPGPPFLFHALSGQFPEVRVETGSVEAQGVRLEDVLLLLRDVRVTFGEVLGGRTGAIRSEGGRGEASLRSPDLVAAFQQQGVDLDVRLEGGTVFVTAPELPEEREAELDLRGSRLILTVRGAPVRHVVRLPVPVEGMEYRTVVIRAGVAVLRFNLAAGRLRPPE